MDVGNAQSLESRTRRRRRASCSNASARAGRCTRCEENYHGEVAERYAFDDGAGEVGFISSVTNPFCGDCTRARLSSEGVFYTCLFARSGLDLRAPLRDGATRRRAALADLEHLDSSRRSLQRTAFHRCTPASSRCVRSRCITSAANRWLSFSHVDSAARPTMVDVGDKVRHQAHGHGGDARAVSCTQSRKRCATQQFNTPKGPVFHTAIIAGTMAAKRTHELIPFCHPLGIEKLQARHRHGGRRRGRSAARCPCTTRPAWRWKR